MEDDQDETEDDWDEMEEDKLLQKKLLQLDYHWRELLPLIPKFVKEN